MRKSGTVLALVIAGMRDNWARHYLIREGFTRYQAARIIRQTVSSSGRLTGNVQYVRFIIDTI